MGSKGSSFIRSRGAVAGLVATVVAGSGALAWQAWAPRAESPLTATGVAAAGQRRETRPTLDPARFVGKAAQAHQVAREMPDLLDALYCYCECDKSIGHKSLLSCYTDGHAAT